jgi:hypothetical protein
MNLREKILADIAAERVRQDEKHGVQRLPDTINEVPYWECNVFDFYEIPTTNRARELYGLAASSRYMTWAHVLLEEFCEAIEAADSGDRAALREELIQVAAVCVKWVEDLDTRP